MNILIAGATGFIGQALTHALQKKKNTITVISRKQKTARKIFTDKNIRIETWDSLRTAVPALIPKQDVIINLCGANIAEKRWSKQRKQVLLDSRLIPTRTLLQLCKDTQSRPTFINASGIGIYGLSETPTKPSGRLSCRAICTMGRLRLLERTKQSTSHNPALCSGSRSQRRHDEETGDAFQAWFSRTYW